MVGAHSTRLTTWAFLTVLVLALVGCGHLVAAAGPEAFTILVAKSGGNFTTLEDAFKWMEGRFPYNTLSISLLIEPGVYPSPGSCDGCYNIPITYKAPLSISSTLGAAGMNSTIIDCRGHTGFSFSHTPLSLLGITVRNCNNPEQRGGAFYVQGDELSSVTLRYTRITQCSADIAGGIYYQGSGSMTMEHVQIDSCRAILSQAGGFYFGGVLLHNSLQISHSSFSSSSALEGGCGFVIESTARIVNSTFTGCSAEDRGGGLVVHASLLTVANTSFHGNKAGFAAGALSMRRSAANVSNTRFLQNVAARGGAIFTDFSSSWRVLMVRDCVFDGDLAYEMGGALYCAYEGNCHVSRSMFTNNKIIAALYLALGGAIHVFRGGSLHAEHCTFINNSATTGGSSSDGGAIYVDAGASVVASGSLFVNNTAWKGGAMLVKGHGTLSECNFTRNGIGTLQGSKLYAPTKSVGGGVSFYKIKGFDASWSVDRCYFASNRARQGGAVSVEWGHLTLTNTVLEHNVAQYGGGLLSGTHSYARMSHVNFLENWAQIAGGGAFYTVPTLDRKQPDCSFTADFNNAADVLNFTRNTAPVGMNFGSEPVSLTIERLFSSTGADLYNPFSDDSTDTSAEQNTLVLIPSHVYLWKVEAVDCWKQRGTKYVGDDQATEFRVYAELLSVHNPSCAEFDVQNASGAIQFSSSAVMAASVRGTLGLRYSASVIALTLDNDDERLRNVSFDYHVGCPPAELPYAPGGGCMQCLPHSSVHAGVVWFLNVLAALLMAFIVANSVYLTKHRHRAIIKASSYQFLMLIQLGSGLAAVQVVMYTVEYYFLFPEQQPVEDIGLWNHWCIPKQWILPIAFDLILGSLVFKTFRIHRLFLGKRRLKRRPPWYLRNPALLSFVGCMVLADVIICTVWTTMFPLNLRAKPISNNFYMRVCKSQHFFVFVLLISVPKLLLLVWGMVLAFQVRSVGRKNFNESRQLGFSIYNFFVLGAIAIPITVAAPISRDVWLVAAGLTIAVGLFAVQGVMVLPKLYRVYKGYRMDSMTKSDKAAASLIYRTPESPASTRKPAAGVSAAARTTRKISQISQDGDAWSLKSRHYLSSPDNQGHGDQGIVSMLSLHSSSGSRSYCDESEITPDVSSSSPKHEREHSWSAPGRPPLGRLSTVASLADTPTTPLLSGTPDE